MNKKISLVLFFIVFISCAYISFGIVEKVSTFPTIKIQFSKITYPNAIVLVNQSSIQLNLTDSIGKSYGLDFVTVPAGGVGSYFEVKTTEALMNGNYTLKIFAKDLLGNNVSTTINLTVDVPYMDILTNSPPLSVSPRPVFDYSIKTAENAYDCRYTSSPFGQYENLIFNFLDSTPLVHTKANFNNASAGSDFGLSDGVESSIYVFCKDDYSDRVNPKTLQISFDTTKPVISVSADPQIVTDKVGGKVAAQIKVSSDDKVVCKYSDFELSNVSTNNSIVYRPVQSSFEQMPFYFGTEGDKDNESKYTKTPATTVDLTLFVTDITKKYTFNGSVACINRATFDLNTYGANRTSATKNVTIVVNLLSPLTITKTSPPDYQSNGSIFLNFTTNRFAICTYNFNGTNGTLATTDNKIHTASLSPNYVQGKYNLAINCAGENSKTESYLIVIDTSAPSAPVVTSPNATCTKSLSARFLANDSESGIGSYNYTIVGVGINVSGQTTSDSVTESSLNLSNQTQYYFTATATNRAGLTSSAGNGNYIVYDETKIACDTKPPSIFLKQNTTSAGVYVTFVCVDDLQCKNDSYMYYLSPDNSCQGIFQSIPYSEERQAFSVLVSQGGYFCYEAEDLARNKAKGYEEIKFQSLASCYNSLQDAGESDVDCGGSSTCERCAESKKCLEDADCISRFCSGGVCIQSSCSDLIKNGYESDVDCGGLLCPKCVLNKTCLVNSDCQSTYCNAGICNSPTCNDTVQNGNETDADCGGNCKKCGIGKFCVINTDCQSGVCSIGKCVQQLIQKNETQKPEPTGNILFKILKIVFLMLGVLGTFGGSGYIYYKKSNPKKPLIPTTLSKTATSVQQAKESAAKSTKPLTADEKIKKLTIQEQLRREQEEKDEKRAKLFGVFGAPRTILKEQPKQPVKPLVAPARRIIIPPVAKQPAVIKKPEAPKKEGLFEQLGKIVPKKDEDVFSRLGKLKGETEFEKLEKIGKGKKEEDIEKLKRKKR